MRAKRTHTEVIGCIPAHTEHSDSNQKQEGKKMFLETMESIGDFLWGTPMLVSIIGCGIVYTLISKGFTFRHFGYIMKNTFGKMKGGNEKDDRISAFQAACVAIGGCVGTGNLGGVASAIATGGPGALLWMWIWAFLGMTIKMGEVALGCYYRQKNEKGEHYGGATYYMIEGIGKQKGMKKLGAALAWLFGITFMFQAISSSQMKTVAEALEASFSIPQIPFACLYTLGLIWVLYKGKTRIAKFASKTVPFMCVLYIVGGLGLIIINYQNLPHVIYSVFYNAFNPTAASGGFVGCVVSRTIRTGVARAINSNEAGMGASPLIHSQAETDHPIRQGLWGCFEVFVDTMIVCSITALAVLSTGVWNSGLSSSALTIEAFRAGYGTVGVVVIGLICLMFGLTTSTGWYVYYCSMIRHAFQKNPLRRDKALHIFKVIYPWPNLIQHQPQRPVGHQGHRHRVPHLLQRCGHAAACRRVRQASQGLQGTLYGHRHGGPQFQSIL